jgi:hypothetical protein
MGKLLDLVGERFGMLEVLSYHSTGSHGKEYLCKCECGQEKIYRSSTLRSGKIIACGCQNFINGCADYKDKAVANRVKTRKSRAKSRIGEVHNRLTVVAIASQNGRHKVVCQCECGRKTVQVYADLKSSKVVSCGCYRNEQASKTGVSFGIVNSKRNQAYVYFKDDKRIIMRSSYEIIFAHLMDSKGLDWEYESQTFKLKNGCRYIPDFYVPSQNEWFEVKGYMSLISKEKIRLFSELGHKITTVTLADLEKETGLKYKQMKGQWAFR